MNRKLAVRFGQAPRALVENRDYSQVVSLGLKDFSGDINFHRLQEQLRRLGIQPSEIGLDLLIVAVGIYAADLCNSRRSFGDDGWTRHLTVDVEVSDLNLWTRAAPPLLQGLRFLSNDVWSFSFTQRGQSREDLGFKKAGSVRFQPSVIGLLSGGLDSAIGGIDILKRGESALFASTYGERQTSAPQKAVFEALKATFPKGQIERVYQPITLPSNLRVDGESTQRARSILFIAFGTMLSTCFEPGTVALSIAENGLIALNVAPRPNRIASNSTKTTHPFFLARIRDVLGKLNLRTTILEPYRFMTKGEMVAASDQPALERILPLTVSCAKAAQLFRIPTNLLHCGSCTACLIRRAAISSGWPEPDPTPGYFFSPTLTKTRLEADPSRGGDIRAFKAAASRLETDPTRSEVDVYRSGPMHDVISEIQQYAAVYKRGLREVGLLLSDVTTFGSQT